MDLRSFLRKTIPKIRKTEQKNIPEERPRPPGIFLSRRKIDSFTIDKIAIIWQRKAASEEIFDHPNSRFMAFTGEDAGTFRVIFQVFCPSVAESKRKFSPRRGLFCPHICGFFASFFRFFIPKRHEKGLWVKQGKNSRFRRVASIRPGKAGKMKGFTPQDRPFAHGHWPSARRRCRRERCGRFPVHRHGRRPPVRPAHSAPPAGW